MHDHSETTPGFENIPVWREQVEAILRELSSAEKLQLIEDVARSLREPVGSVANWRENLDRLRDEMAALPIHNPADGFSNRDHDRVLYGDAT